VNKERVFLSGATSFTGMHIANTLTEAKHHVTASFRRHVFEYDGLKAQRISLLPKVQKSENAHIGSTEFCRTISSFKPDIYIHHGFDTTDYNTPNFPMRSRIDEALHNMDRVCHALAEEGCKGIVYSDSIFSGSGAINCDGVVPFSPYGKAKLEIGDRMESLCEKHQLSFWRVVIPNPIGLLDNHKLLKHVFTAWSQGKTPTLFTPDLVRDNLPVEILSRHYLDVCRRVLAGNSGISNPSGWVCSVKELVQRAGRAWTRQTGDPAPFRSEAQATSQPQSLYNTAPVLTETGDWSEDHFWNELIKEALN
jgi:nucleoside-diphosphate-sugar epimerase